MTADDRENLIAYLVREGYLTNDLAYKGAEGRGYDIHPGAGVDPGPGKLDHAQQLQRCPGGRLPGRPWDP